MKEVVTFSDFNLNALDIKVNTFIVTNHAQLHGVSLASSIDPASGRLVFSMAVIWSKA